MCSVRQSHQAREEAGKFKFGYRWWLLVSDSGGQ
uniref:Uncharacterized protein n=1 Tax=Anguilla anguilla TaxID=7936 RepID=A0A0E9V3N6_ANGAN